jgi:hypothetical protein
MSSDEDKLDALVMVLRGLAEAAMQEQRPTTPTVGEAGDQAGNRATTSNDRDDWPQRLDVGVLEILAANSFDEQVALQRLVADAFRD